MKKVVPLALAWLCLTVPAAEARPGTIDPTFGHRGEAAWPLRLSHELRNAATAIGRLPNGGAVALADNRLIAVDSDGTLRRGFSRDGFAGARLPFAAPLGASLELVDLATDRQGRIVLVGTLTSPANPSVNLVGEDASVLVARLTPHGYYDKTFGERGFLVTDLGFRSPPVEPPFVPPIEPPAVTRGAGVAIDANRTIFLSGVGISRIAPCSSREYFAFKDGFVARLREDGEPDPSFGQGGLAIIPGVRTVQNPLVTGSGGTFLAKRPERECTGSGQQIARVSSQGAVAAGFGDEAELFDSDSTLALDRRNRLLLSWPWSKTIWHGEPGPGKSVQFGYLRRLRPNGEVDTSFAEEGTATLQLPGGDFTPSQVLVDRGGRILVAGAATPKADRNDRGLFLLSRLSPDGDLDKQFGSRGWAHARWGDEALVGNLSAIFVTGGRVLVAGVLSDPALKYDAGIGFARFLIR